MADLVDLASSISMSGEIVSECCLLAHGVNISHRDFFTVVSTKGNRRQSSDIGLLASNTIASNNYGRSDRKHGTIQSKVKKIIPRFNQPYY